MSTTIQILMAAFTVAGFAIAKLHTFLSSPVGSDVMTAIFETAQHQQKMQGHAKLARLAQHSNGLLHNLALAKSAADQGVQAAGGANVNAELQAALAQLNEIVQAKQTTAE